MDGADDATEQQKADGRQDQAVADDARDRSLDDSIRSIRTVGEDRSSEER